jgi:hypothetical protein
MNKSMILGLALSAATLGLSGATMATADAYDNNRRQDQYDNRHQGQYDNRQHTQSGDWRNTRARDFTGVWRLDSRRGNAPGSLNNGWNGRAGDLRGYRNVGAMQLPAVIQIERGRGEFRVESQNGRLIRRIETSGRGDWNGNRFEVQSTMRGSTVTEVFSLQSGGRELVVRTIVEGRRGTQEFTSVYDRA